MPIVCLHSLFEKSKKSMVTQKQQVRAWVSLPYITLILAKTRCKVCAMDWWQQIDNDQVGFSGDG